MIPARAEPISLGAPDASLSERAYRTVMDMLMRGTLRPNEVVGERQLAEQLGISRTPLREAVRRLEGERLLERQRSGVLVVRPVPLEECLQILGVRRLLEGEATRLAAGHTPKEPLERLRRTIEKTRRLPADAAVDSYAASDRDLHLLIAAACGNPVLKQMIEDLRKRMAIIRFGSGPARRHKVCDEHIAIIDAVLAGDGETARAAMAGHIDQVRITILDRLAGH